MVIELKAKLNYSVNDSLSAAAILKFIKDHTDCEITKLSNGHQKLYKVEDIKTLIIRYFNVEKTDFESKRRYRELVQARQVAMYFCVKYTKDSLSKIGYKIGYKNHATVIHACKTVQNYIDTDRHFRQIIYELENRIG